MLTHHHRSRWQRPLLVLALGLLLTGAASCADDHAQADHQPKVTQAQRAESKRLKAKHSSLKKALAAKEAKAESLKKKRAALESEQAAAESKAAAESSAEAAASSSKAAAASSSAAVASSKAAQAASTAKVQAAAASSSAAVARQRAASQRAASQRAASSQGHAVTNRGDMNTAATGKIVGNRNSHIYHVPGQAGYRMNSANAVYFNSEAEARAAGYRKALR
ncbi:DNA-entry nuclease [Lacticaseibacillus absianus]|uniref:sunset domain-containing protein n=1 Tax=Lacticaseibacillus absianus TaxID=2729623 RepID=UPI0015CDCE44|nr:DNA-entry nuclease [Lacticaseibacillus absianus]